MSNINTNFTTAHLLVTTKRKVLECIGSPNGRLAATTIQNGEEYVVYCDEIQFKDDTIIFVNPSHDMEGNVPLNDE